MLYNTIKIFHILSATAILTSMAYCAGLWYGITNKADIAFVSARIKLQTHSIIIVLTLLQLLSGFTLISIKHYDFKALWLNVSFMGFVFLIAAWFGFVYSLLGLEQRAQLEIGNQLPITYQRNRKIQALLLGICGLTILIMVFFMANKIP